jgi:hypothetical protein
MLTTQIKYCIFGCLDDMDHLQSSRPGTVRLGTLSVGDAMDMALDAMLAAARATTYA